MTLQHSTIGVPLLAGVALICWSAPSFGQDADVPDPRTAAFDESLDDRDHPLDESADPLRDHAADPRPELPAIVQRDGDLRPIALPGGESKSAVTPQALSLPSGGGSVDGLGESFAPLLSSGTATFSVPVALPPGRRGTQPGLSFSYSSSSGNGVCGIGWSIAVPFIARQTDKGLPRYDGTDRFVYNGGQELVEVERAADADGNPDNGVERERVPGFVEEFRYFRARVEGAYLRFFLAPDESYWVVQDKDGTFFYLGESEQSRVEHPDWGVFSWSLTRIVDLRGNEVRFLYGRNGDDRQVYLAEAVWNSPVAFADGNVWPVLGASSEEFQHSATFTYEDRADEIDSYVSRFRVTTSRRLARVDVSSYLAAGDPRRTLDRAYVLSYEEESFLSLLTSIEVEGRDGTALPPLTFGYSEVEPHAAEGGEVAEDLPGWGGFDGRVYEIEQSPDHSLDEGRTDLFDIDADAFPDVLVTDPARYDDGHGVYFLEMVDGALAYSAADVIDVPGWIGGDLSLSNTNVNPMDLDGDGRVELLHMPHVRDWSTFSAVGSREAGWAWVQRGPYDPAHEDIDFTRDAAEIRLVDVDNDNRVDVIRTSGTRTEYYRNRGDGTFEDPVTSCALHRGLPVRFSDGNLVLADMNGDGLQDLVHLRRGDVAYWPGRGPGIWGGDADLNADCPSRTFGDDREVVMDEGEAPFWSDLEDDRIRLSDVNGDGLSDLVQTRFSSVDIWVNEGGRGFTGRYIIERSPFDPGFTQRVRLADVNASGSRDVLWGNAEHYRYMDLTGGIRPRLLVRVDNGLGKTTELGYEPHTAQQSRAADRGEPWTTFSPFPVQVVSRMTVRDNLGGEYVTEYEYRDALYDGLESEFRGFRQAVVRTIGDENSPTSEQRTVFWQGERPDGADPDDNPLEALKGAVRLTETCDLAGTCLQTTHTTWRVRKLYDGANGDPRSVWQATSEQTDTFRYDTAPFDPSADTTDLQGIAHDDPALSIEDTVALRGETYAHLRSESEVDAAGNQLRLAALGVVDTATDDIVTHTTWTNVSDWLWRPEESFIEPDLQRTRSVFNELGELTDSHVRLSEENREIHKVHNEYDGVGQLTLVEEGGEDDLALRRRLLGYDADHHAYLVEEEIATGPETSLTAAASWDAGFGVITELRDYNGQPTVIEYDGLSRVASIVQPGCAEAAVRYEYLLAGDTGSAINEVVTRSNEHCGDGVPEDVATSLESHAYVDGLGRARMSLAEADPLRGDPSGWVRSGYVTFDAKGAASRAYQPDFAGDADFSLDRPRDGYTSTRYDAFGREVRSVAPDRLAATETLYHALSTEIWDPNDLDPTSGHYGTPTTSVQDGQGRLVTTIERNLVDGALEEYVASYSYNPLGNLLTIDRTFGDRNVHRELSYDSLGRRITNDDPDSGSWTYEYSDVGDLVATTDARGTRVAYAYDLAGRLVTEDYDDDGSVEVTYVFDELRGNDEPADYGRGRLTTVHDLSGTTEFFYDARGRQALMARTLEHDDVRREESSTYDELDREMSLTYPDGSVASYEYTDRGLLYSASLDAFTAVRRIEYAATGQKLVEELGDAEATRNEYVYDRRRRLMRLTSVTGAGRYYQDNQYEYDHASNVTAIRDLRTLDETGDWSPSPADQDYQYDALYRLVRNRTTYAQGEPDRPHDQTWRYDYLGNMIDWRDDQSRFYDRSLGAITNGIDADPTGAVRPDALVSARLDDENHLEATYNASGDMEALQVTTGGATTAHAYEWDEVHRLTRATISPLLADPGGGEVGGGEIGLDAPVESTFTYDYADQRRVKDSPDDTVLYVSDSFELRNGEPTKWLHVGGQRLLRIDAAGGGDRISLYLSNHLGTTSLVVDEQGDPRSASTYLPYGALESEITALDDLGFEPAYRFTGKERDPATSLDYFGARYLNPNLARWTAPDPLSTHSPSNGSRGNPFAYAAGCPVRLVDPGGTQEQKPTTAADVFKAGMVGYVAHVSAAVETVGAAAMAGVAAPAVATQMGIEYARYAAGVVEGGGIPLPPPLWLNQRTAEGIVSEVRETVSRVESATDLVSRVESVADRITGPVAGQVAVAAASFGMGELAAGESVVVRAATQAEVSSAAPTTAAARGVTTVYRVEGAVNQRLVIGAAGNVSVQGRNMLFLNFGDAARAEQFLATRVAQGMDGATMRSFQVPTSFVDELVASAVPESMGRQFPNAPLVVDVTRAANQFGLRPAQIEALERAIIAGSGR